MTTVIIGGGVGGVYTAYYLVKNGYNPSRITIISPGTPHTKHRLASLLREKNPTPYVEINTAKLFPKHHPKILKTKATKINTSTRTITLQTGKKIRYKHLVIATGAKPRIPAIEGVHLENTLTFHVPRDLEKLARISQPRKIAVIGAGLVGLTLASALHREGHKVTVYEAEENILPGTLEPPLSRKLRKHLETNGIKIQANTRITAVKGKRKVEAIQTSGGTRETDIVIFTTGVKPNTKITENTGIEKHLEAIKTQRTGETSTKNIYALGDCATSHDQITGKTVYRPLGYIAAHYARIIAQNITGTKTFTKGVIPTIYENINNIHTIKIGLTQKEAEQLGLKPTTLKCTTTQSQATCTIKHEAQTIGYQEIALTNKPRTKILEIYNQIKREIRTCD